MRIWHTDLIPVLPKQQLNGEWRELNTIFKAKKPINHLLINFAYDYPKAHLLAYAIKILAERKRRGYKYNTAAMNEYFTAEDYAEAEKITVPFPNKMTERYLIQCYYNLQEKYDCGGVTDGEWIRILDVFGEFDNLKVKLQEAEKWLFAYKPLALAFGLAVEQGALSEEDKYRYIAKALGVGKFSLTRL